MSINQLFFAMAGLFITGLGLSLGFLKYYIDAKFDGTGAKIDPIAKNVDLLVQYMVSHEGKISRLEERTSQK